MSSDETQEIINSSDFNKGETEDLQEFVSRLMEKGYSVILGNVILSRAEQGKGTPEFKLYNLASPYASNYQGRIMTLLGGSSSAVNLASFDHFRTVANQLHDNISNAAKLDNNDWAKLVNEVAALKENQNEVETKRLVDELYPFSQVHIAGH